MGWNTTGKTALLFALLLALPLVAGHAEPWTSNPADQERLARSPTEVTVTFDEPIYADGSWIQVWDLSGNRVDNDDLQVTLGDNPVLKVTVPRLPDGPYRVYWQSYSPSDGHVIRDAFGFSIGEFVPPVALGSADNVPVSAALARAVLYLGYTLAIGAFLFGATVLRRDITSEQQQLLDRFLLAGAGIHLAGVLWLVTDTALRSSLTLSALVSSPGGTSLWTRVVLAAAVLLLTTLWLHGPVRPRFARPVLAGLWVLAVATGARLGHADTPSAWFVQTLHGLSIAGWLGGLFALLAMAWLARHHPTRHQDVQHLGLRFSTLAMATVAGMAFTGLALALTILGVSLLDPRLWLAGTWRGFLSAKLALVVAMLALAVVNREVFVAKEEKVGRFRRILRDVANRKLRWRSIHQAGGTKNFRTVVAVEAVFGVAVIVCAGFLMSVAPPEGEPTTSFDTYLAGSAGKNHTASIEVSPFPARGHLSDVRMQLWREDGSPFTSADCAMNATNNTPCLLLEWWPVGANRTGAPGAVGLPEQEGEWLFERLQFDRPTDYRLSLRITPAEGSPDIVAFTVPVTRNR